MVLSFLIPECALHARARIRFDKQNQFIISVLSTNLLQKYSFFSTCPRDVIIPKPFRKRMKKLKFRKQILKSIDFKHQIPDQRQIYKTITLLTTLITKANAVYMRTLARFRYRRRQHRFRRFRCFCGFISDLLYNIYLTLEPDRYFALKTPLTW